MGTRRPEWRRDLIGRFEKSYVDSVFDGMYVARHAPNVDFAHAFFVSPVSVFREMLWIEIFG